MRCVLGSCSSQTQALRVWVSLQAAMLCPSSSSCLHTAPSSPGTGQLWECQPSAPAALPRTGSWGWLPRHPKPLTADQRFPLAPCLWASFSTELGKGLHRAYLRMAKPLMVDQRFPLTLCCSCGAGTLWVCCKILKFQPAALQAGFSTEQENQAQQSLQSWWLVLWQCTTSPWPWGHEQVLESPARTSSSTQQGWGIPTQLEGACKAWPCHSSAVSSFHTALCCQGMASGGSFPACLHSCRVCGCSVLGNMWNHVSTLQLLDLLAQVCICRCLCFQKNALERSPSFELQKCFWSMLGTKRGAKNLF